MRSSPIPTLTVSFALVLIACEAGPGGDDAQDGAADAAAPDAAAADAAAPDAAALPPELAGFHDAAAAAVCGALFRCCEPGDVHEYFAPLAANESLAAFADRLPPADEPACRDVLAEIFAVMPFGDWVAEAAAGRVTYVPEAFAACVAALDGAACGGEARAALYDSTCFAFAPPEGGAVQRAMFARTATAGAACAPIRDGVGAAFYGTCAAEAAFCCYQDPAAPGAGCGYPFGMGGVKRSGVCQAVAPEGGACSFAPPLQLCATGVSCDDTSATCTAAGTGPLAIGELCVDDAFNLLGECVGSYCDLLGSDRCEPLKPTGAACSAGHECQAGACKDQECQAITFCSLGVPGDADAGLPGPADAGAATLDAAPLPADAGAPLPATGETCGEALDLAAASVASPVPGFAARATGAFGVANDYNPYQDANPPLPPACSIVYDAIGREVVYAVTLTPGDTLSMRLEVTPANVPPAIYVLDGCAPVTWPDYDGSGACGSNEYGTPGFCSLGLCDPELQSFTYPEALAGAPTTTKTFWIVVDSVASAAGTGYTLDWKVTPAP